MRAVCSFTAILLAIPQLAYTQTAPGIITATPSSLSFSFASGGSVPRPQTLALTTTPGATASFTVAFSSTSGGTWLDVAPISGTVNGATPTNLSVSVDPFSGLAPGSYNGTITINQTLKIPVTVTVTTALVAAPSSLSFSTQQVGTTAPAPPVQTINVTSGGSIPFSAVASSSGNWLAVSPPSSTTPAALSVSINPAGLAAGNYTGSITLSSLAAPNVTIAVNLTILPPLMFTLSPASLSFQATSAFPQPPSQTVSVFSNVPAALFATATAASGNTWLTVAQSAAQTPVALTISVQAGLAAGTYSGQIALSTAKGGPNVATIPVNYTVAAPQSATLQVSPDTLTFSSAQGGLPIQQALAVSNAGGGALNYNAQITAQSGGNWLTLQSTSGTATAGAPGSVPFTITPGTLTPGTYNATVTVTGSGQTASTLIVLSISAQGPSLALSQTGLVYTTTAQAPNPPSQTVSVVNTGSGSLAWNVTASTLSGGNWLSATPMSGITQPLPATPPAVTVSVNSQGLAPGTYYGSVKVNTQVISVQTTVLPAGQQLSPSLSTNGLVFTAAAGGANAVAQSISIANPLSFTSTVSTADGANWLSITPAATSVSVQAALTTLTPGIRYGTVRLGFTDGSVQTINVVSVTAPAGTAPQISSDARIRYTLFPDATGCPSVLVPQITSLASNFAANASQSVPLSVTVVDNCGHALPNSSSSSVIASFYDASQTPGPAAKIQPDQHLTPQGNGVWAGTWTPLTATAQAEIIVVALGINGTTPIAGQSMLNGTVHAAGANAPALPIGIFNAASYQPGNAIALGSFVSIFGANLADGSGAPNTQPLPTSYQGTQVFLGGVALPLQYAGPNQINALIPANVAVDSQQPLVVQRDLTQAAPTSVTIADAQPGIYTANQQGSGQGAVLNSDYSYNGSRAASRGDYIQIFCTGLGAVTNPPPTGAAAPNTPLSYTVSTVTASIAGINAPVLFSGLAPGFIGLYQVNATIPLSAPVGPAVALTLSVGSAVSNTATIQIQ